MKAFAPAVGDSAAFAMDKLNPLEEIMTQFIFVQDPTGKLNLQPITGQGAAQPVKQQPKLPKGIKIKNFKVTE